MKYTSFIMGNFCSSELDNYVLTSFICPRHYTSKQLNDIVSKLRD